ncbi:hypothetical protein CDAR_177441 [Caerostris darwini]|uniref:Uncharacterized protein n=1 Tax=Caerostris darwini TaxID=1538125 RepID=A0AAV4P4H9_9ARAC|nr:hypothetical protein CDAR_177441 [Caerostris darwini]
MTRTKSQPPSLPPKITPIRVWPPSLCKQTAIHQLHGSIRQANPASISLLGGKHLLSYTFLHSGSSHQRSTQGDRYGDYQDIFTAKNAFILSFPSYIWRVVWVGWHSSRLLLQWWSVSRRWTRDTFCMLFLRVV